MQKKNSKLESFLYRTLPEAKYERIRGYESCVVVSEKENKAFKYVVLGDEWIYLTENPPKVIQETVGLGDIISVELINDYPDFLMGDDKRNSQHLAITHWTSDPVKRLSFRRKKSPRSGSLSDLHGDRSNASTPLSYISSQDVLSEDHGYSSLSSTQFNRPDSRGSQTSAREIRKGSISKKKKKGSNKLHTIQSESEDMILKSLKEELEEDILEDLENQSELGDSNMTRSINSTRNSKSARSTHSSKSSKVKKTPRPLPQSPLPKTRAFETPAIDKSASVVVNHNDDLPLKNGGPNDNHEQKESTPSCFSCCSLSLGKSRVVPFCGGDRSPPRKDNKGRLFSASELSNKPMSDVHIEISSVTEAHFNRDRRSSIHSSVTTLRGHVSRADTPGQDDFERRSVLSMASVSDFGGSINRLSVHSLDGPVGGSGLLEKRRAVLHIYLLSKFSPHIGVLSMASVSDFGGSINRLSVHSLDGPVGGLLEKRRAVLHIYLLSKESPMLMLIRSAWSNYLLAATLMMNSDSDVPETPRGSVTRVPNAQRGKTDMLFQELKRDILRPDNDLERTYLLLNELKLATEKNFSLKRLFWKNSELFHFCVKNLQQLLPKSATGAQKDRRTDELEFVTLIVEILCMMFHESEIIPERTQALKAERGRSVVGLLMVLTCTPDIPENMSPETKKVVLDFTRTSLATVFELFLMAKQANWGYSEGHFYNISWMATTLEEIKDTEKFVTRLITMVMEYLSPNSVDRLSPVQAVLLYQQLFILETFLKYSPRIRTFICATYTEEFKYYIQPPVIMRKLPQNYPIYHTLVALIDDVLKRVLPPTKTSKDR